MNSANLRSNLSQGGLVTIPPGVYTFDRPIELADAPVVIRGSGIGLTELRFNGEGVNGLVAEQTSLYNLVDISDLTITSSAKQGGIAIKASWPEVGAFHDPTMLLDRVRIKPSSGNEMDGAFRKGIELHGAWSPTFTKLWVQGAYNDQTPEAMKNPQMECGVDFGNAQEGKLSHSQIVCMEVGVHVEADAQGKGEGLGVTSCAIVNADRGVFAEGGNWGGWPVPWLSVTDSHLFTLSQAVLAVGRSDINLSGNSVCGSHMGQGTVGFYLVGGCKNARISGNHFWTTKPGQGYGIVVDGATGGIIEGNVFDSSVNIAMFLTAKSKGFVIGQNANESAYKLADYQEVKKAA